MAKKLSEFLTEGKKSSKPRTHSVVSMPYHAVDELETEPGDPKVHAHKVSYEEAHRVAKKVHEDALAKHARRAKRYDYEAPKGRVLKKDNYYIEGSGGEDLHSTHVVKDD